MISREVLDRRLHYPFRETLRPILERNSRTVQIECGHVIEARRENQFDHLVVGKMFGELQPGFIGNRGMMVQFVHHSDPKLPTLVRSEERRVGKGGFSTCRSRGWPDH